MKVRYGYEFVDYRGIFGNSFSSESSPPPTYYGKESVDKGWACSYCRTLYVDQRTSCPNCGAPR